MLNLYFVVLVVVIVIIIVTISYNLYLHRYSFNRPNNDNQNEPKNSLVIIKNDYSEFQPYFFKNTNILENTKKPILWIYLSLDYAPYLHLTIRSIIKKCHKSFEIVLIRNDTFEQIIPNWTKDLTNKYKDLPESMRVYFYQMALVKLIYLYGGMVVPMSFLCLQDLISLYNYGTRRDCMFISENYRINIEASRGNIPPFALFYPSCEFFGAKKGNEIINQLIQFITAFFSPNKDKNAVYIEREFYGDLNSWHFSHLYNDDLILIDGRLTGVKTVDKFHVYIMNNNDFIHFDQKMYGIWIPDHSFDWLSQLSIKQLLESKYILSKYFILASK